MALQPEKGLGPILNAIDIIVADTQQKRREVRDDRIRQEGFDREDTQRLQSGKITALGKIFAIKGIDPPQKQKAFDTIIETLANPDTDIPSFELPEKEQRFDLTPEDIEAFPALEGFRPDLPGLFNIKKQRTTEQQTADQRDLVKANIQNIRARTQKILSGKTDKTKKDTTKKDFVKNLDEFIRTVTEESKRISQKDILDVTGRRFVGKSGQEERFKELETELKPELEKLKRTVLGFRSTSIEELSKWVERGWLGKDMMKQLLIDNGLLDEFNDQTQNPQTQNPQPQKRKLQGF